MAATVKPLPSRPGGSRPMAPCCGVSSVTGPLAFSAARNFCDSPSSMPSLSQTMEGAFSFQCASTAAAAARSPGQGIGSSPRACRSASPAFKRPVGGVLAVGSSNTGRSPAPCSRSVMARARSAQPSAAVQPLSTTSTSGPEVGGVRPRPHIGSASARISRAAASRRSSSSHQGVLAGVSSSLIRPASSRSGGNICGLGAGGVTRNSSKITGKAARPSNSHGAPKLSGAKIPTRHIFPEDVWPPMAAYSPISAACGG